jgi:CBS domain-containing protein
MIVGHVLEKKGLQRFCTTENRLLTEAAVIMCENRVGSLVVMGGEVIKSIVTERDVMMAVGRYNGEISTVKIADVMPTMLVTCDIGDTLDRVMDLMINNETGHRIRHLPVLDNGKLAGVISISDIVEALLTKVEFENKLLKNYIKNWPDGEAV